MSEDLVPLEHPNTFGEVDPKLVHHISILDKVNDLVSMKSRGYKMYRTGKLLSVEEFNKWVSKRTDIL
jgi:hypothetical protein